MNKPIASRLEKAVAKRDLAKVALETAQLNVAYKQYTNPNLAPSKNRGRGWTSPGIAERDLNRWDREQAMAQARELAETRSLVAGMVQTCVDNVIGPEYRLKMTTPNVAFNKQVEELWRVEKDQLDIRGIRSWGKLQRCWQYRKVIDGDVGIHKFVDDRNGNAFRVATIEADRIRYKKADYLDQGIEFDEYGRHKRYFIGRRPINQIDQGAMLEDGTPISAADMVLYAHYPNERSERMRGTSMLLPCFNELRDIDEIMCAITQKIKNAAFIGLKFRMDAGPTGAIFGGLEQSVNGEDGKKRTTVPMVAGTNINLGAGEDVSVLESTVPNSELVPFLKFRLRHVGVVLGMPLEFLMFEFEGSYSSARAVMEMAKRRFLCEQQSAAYLASNVFTGWLEHQIEMQTVDVPADVSDPFRHRWGRPGWPYINPQQEVGAQEMQINNGLKSRAAILQETTGGDIDDIIAELGHEAAAMVAAGVGESGAKVSRPDFSTETDITPNASPTLPDEKEAGTIAETTLNGAQITAAVEVISRLTRKEMSKVSAVELLVAVGLKREDAEKMIGAEQNTAPVESASAVIGAK